MLGIWEYFFDILDWITVTPAATNLCQVTATVSEVNVVSAVTAQLNTQTRTV